MEGEMNIVAEIDDDYEITKWDYDEDYLKMSDGY